MEEIKDRIKIIMDRSNLTSSAFAESIGIQQSTLSHILSGRNNPSLDVVMKVYQAYNDISIHWLLYGEGNMIETTTKANPYTGSLFDVEPLNPSEDATRVENRKEMALASPGKSDENIINQRIKYIEKPPRKIVEIRIFFDDNTYEVYKGDV